MINEPSFQTISRLKPVLPKPGLGDTPAKVLGLGANWLISQFPTVRKAGYSGHLPQPVTALLHDLVGDLIRIVATGKANQRLSVLIAECLHLPIGMA